MTSYLLRHREGSDLPTSPHRIIRAAMCVGIVLGLPNCSYAEKPNPHKPLIIQVTCPEGSQPAPVSEGAYGQSRFNVDGFGNVHVLADCSGTTNPPLTIEPIYNSNDPQPTGAHIGRLAITVLGIHTNTPDGSSSPFVDDFDIFTDPDTKDSRARVNIVGARQLLWVESSQS